MEFYETEQGRLGMREMPPLLAELLRQAPRVCEWESEVVEERLFPEPAEGLAEENLREDWKAHVQPELHDFFLSSRQTMEADLRGLREEEDVFALEFPASHAEAWLNALNQARLALAAVHGFDDSELSQPGPLEIVSERSLALLQINFYAAIQQWLVETLGGE